MDFTNLMKKRKEIYPGNQGPMTPITNPYRQPNQSVMQPGQLNKLQTAQQTKTPQMSPAYSANGTPNFKAPAQPTAPTATSSYLDYLKTRQPQMDATRGREEELARARFESGQRERSAMYDQNRQNAESQLPELEKLRDSTVKGIRATAEQNKQNIIDQSGESRRIALNLKKKQDVQLANKFANLGTLESQGYGTYGGQSQESNQQFQTDIQNMENERLNKVTELDTQTTNSINSVISEFNTKIGAIRTQLATDPIARQRAEEEAYLGLEQTLNDIKKGYDTESMNLAKATYDTAIASQKAGTDGKYEGLENNISQSLDDLIMVGAEGLGGVTGWGSWQSYIPEGKAAGVKAQLDNLKAQLQLRSAELLKGAGQISDGEREILRQASARLNGNLSPQDLMAELQRLKSLYGSSTPTQQSGSVRMQSPDGSMYTVDQSEVQEATRNGWRTM